MDPIIAALSCRTAVRSTLPPLFTGGGVCVEAGGGAPTGRPVPEIGGANEVVGGGNVVVVDGGEFVTLGKLPKGFGAGRLVGGGVATGGGGGGLPKLRSLVWLAAEKFETSVLILRPLRSSRKTSLPTTFHM